MSDKIFFIWMTIIYFTSSTITEIIFAKFRISESFTPTLAAVFLTLLTGLGIFLYHVQ